MKEYFLVNISVFDACILRLKAILSISVTKHSAADSEHIYKIKHDFRSGKTSKQLTL